MLKLNFPPFLVFIEKAEYVSCLWALSYGGKGGKYCCFQMNFGKGDVFLILYKENN